MKRALCALPLLLVATLTNAQDLNIEYSSLIAPESVEVLKLDIEKLKRWKFSPTLLDDNLVAKMGVSEIESNALISWLNERVSYIVDQNFDRDSGIYEDPSYFGYPSPFDFPTIEDSFEVNSKKKKLYTVMSNIGTAAYIQGKASRKLLGMKFTTDQGIENVLIKSPRVGILKVGPGLFHEKLSINPNDINADANSIYRLTTLFHEARHSDGNATTIGFFHATCPKGHTYAGKSACDRNLNGPYTIDALLTQKLIEGCDSCSNEEKEVLRLRALDSLDRVIKVTEKMQLTKEVQEKIAQYEQSISNNNTYLSRLYTSDYINPRQEMMYTNAIERARNAIADLIENGERVLVKVDSTDWDDSPEIKK